MYSSVFEMKLQEEKSSEVVSLANGEMRDALLARQQLIIFIMVIIRNGMPYE